jgi:hypothetical protein
MPVAPPAPKPLPAQAPPIRVEPEGPTPAGPAPETATAPVPDDAVMGAPPAPPAAPSLTLRFASDSDFMRLVIRGDVRLFAFRSGDVLALEPPASFRPSPAPGRIYELLPATIPEPLTRALGPDRDPESYGWGIRIPPRMERQIQQHLEQNVSGVLVINRYGDVEHEANA